MGSGLRDQHKAIAARQHLFRHLVGENAAVVRLSLHAPDEGVLIEGEGVDDLVVYGGRAGDAQDRLRAAAVSASDWRKSARAAP